MNKIMTTIAAFGALFAASAATAEPIQNTPDYYYLGAGDDSLGLASNMIEKEGANNRSIWVLVFFQKPQDMGDKKVEGLWALTQFNCANATSRFIRTEAMMADSDTNVAVTDTPTDWETVKTGTDTPGGKLYSFVCKGDTSSVDLLTTEQAAKLMVEFRDQ